MKTLTLTLFCLALAAQAQPDLNVMTLVGQYVGEGYDNAFGAGTAIGDFDDDGFGEFIIGAGWWNNHTGKNYFYDWDGNWPATYLWAFQGDSQLYNFDYDDQNLGDINNDSVDDFALSEYHAGQDYHSANFYFGGAGFDTIPDFIIFQNEGYGVHTPDSCGDVNGDGGNDFVLSARPIYYSEIRIYFGGDDLDSIFDWRYTTNDPNPVGRGLGDVNGDGFSDVMVLLGQNFHPLVFFGGNPMDTIPDLTFYDYTYDNTAAIGDVNADGFSDISILLWPQSMGIGSAIYLGGTDVDTIRDVILLDDWGDPTYTAFVTHGDVNGDGISDLITGDANSAGRASYVYLGGPWFNGVPDARIQGVASYYNWGEEISVGDLNGDGRDEILISSSNYWFEQGLAQLFTGPEGEWIDYGAVVAPGDLSHTPGWYKLAQNYPNPFNSSTSIHFELGKPSTVNLKIYDIQGNEIKQLIVNKEMLPGGYNVSWNSKNEHNQAVSSGIYLLELQVDQYRQMKKMVLVR